MAQEQDLSGNKAATVRVHSQAELLEDSEPKHCGVPGPSENNAGPNLPALHPHADIAGLPHDPPPICDPESYPLGGPDTQGSQNPAGKHRQGCPRIHKDFNALGSVPPSRRQDFYVDPDNAHVGEIVPWRAPMFNSRPDISAGADMKDSDLNDPMELVGVELPEGDLNEMAECFLEELIRDGWDDESLLRLFSDPFYRFPYRIYQEKGEAYVMSLIAALRKKWGYWKGDDIPSRLRMDEMKKQYFKEVKGDG